MPDFDVQGARAAGYSDKEIADHLAATSKFDAEAARQSGYGDKDIIEHLAPGPGLVSRVASATKDAFKTADDWATTRANEAAGSLISLPGVAAQGTEWLGNKLGIDPNWLGPQYAKVLQAMKEHPTAAQITGELQDRTGKKPVNLEGNIPGGRIIDKATEGLMSAAMTGGTSLPALLAGAGGGAVSETAGQVAHDVAPEYETEARLGGALLGGGTGATIPSVVRKATDTTKAAIAPFTQAGRTNIVGTALRDVSADPEAAITNLDKYAIGREAFPDAVPGFKLDAGKVSRDPGLMAAADVRPDAVRGFNVQNNNAALTGALDTATAGLPPSVDAGGTVQKILADRFKTLQEARSAAADPLYAAARNFPEDLPISPLFKYTDEAIAANKGPPQAVMKQAQKLLLDADGRPDFSAQGLMSARDGVGSLIAGVPVTDKYSRSLLKGLQTKIDDTLQSIPEAAQARQTFADYSKPLEPFGRKTQAGKTVAIDPLTKSFVLPEGKVLGDLRAQDVKNVLMAGGGDATIKSNIASAYLDDFRSTVGNNVQRDAAGNPMLGASPAAKWMAKNRGDARNVLSDDQLQALDDITKHLGDQAQAVPGRSGSPTFDRLASESILSAIIGRKEVPAWLHPIQKALTLGGVIDIYGGANKQALDQLMKVIEDPAATAALMKQATPGNAKMVEPLLLSLGRGTALPALTSGERAKP